MTIQGINDIFEKRFDKCISSWAIKKDIVSCKDTLAEISKDGSNLLCRYKNKFFSYDYIAKEFGATESSSDMIFFDMDRDYIVLVEFKNGRVKDKKSIQVKLLNSFVILQKILKLSKEEFWQLKTYFVFVTNKEKNRGQEQYREYQYGSLDVLNYLRNDVVLYGFDKYRPWYFNKIKTPFCDEFAQLMEQEFQIILEEDQ